VLKTSPRHPGLLTPLDVNSPGDTKTENNRRLRLIPLLGVWLLGGCSVVIIPSTNPGVNSNENPKENVTPWFKKAVQEQVRQ